MVPAIAHPTLQERQHITVQGLVQGVGFRPFVYALATDLGLTGWVQNSSQGVTIEVEGTPELLSTFLSRLKLEKPPHATLQQLETQQIAVVNEKSFTIRPSEENHQKTALILPDLATCPACLQEIFDPQNRRYRYPFTNCTHCGPRFSILKSLPYDRPNTTMQGFRMCPVCQSEYENPRDRRFHAQPNACPVCGPHLELWDAQGTVLAAQDEALLATIAAIRQGKVLAIKGLGGFHLIVDAQNEEAVRVLRQRKHRPDKPLAVMVPSIDWAKLHTNINEREAELLQSSEAPIMLVKWGDPPKSPLKKGTSNPIAWSLAPGNPYLGIMLPYTPLHHLLLHELQTPIVATSGNLSSEPICTDEQDAVEKLGAIADLFLVHNRPIARPVDDSIVRVIEDQPIILRRARGYTPLPLELSEASETSILAVGAHLKNTVALSFNQKILVSQHLGDLETPETLIRFHEAVNHLLSLYEMTPDAIACDLHPDYYSSQFAHIQTASKIIPIQHHYAHVLSCMADNQIQPPVLGIAWDGTGYGTDGTIWGGEFLAVTEQPKFTRIAHWRPFRLPGRDQAVKEPRRSLLGLLYEGWGETIFERSDLAALQTFSSTELKILKSMLSKPMNAPLTSSMGRLFDAIASLLNLCHKSSFEGQAAMALEFAIADGGTDESYPFKMHDLERQPIVLDWQPIVQAIGQDLQAKIPLSLIAAKFHHTLVEAMIAIARHAQIPQVALTGGCFQNRYLLEKAIQRLRQEGFTPYWHHRIPSNDGGIAVGQVMGALRQLNKNKMQEVK